MSIESEYRVIVVDDETIIADSLANLLDSTFNGKLDVYKAYSAKHALEYLERTSFDIMILDIQMPGMSGLELQGEMRKRWPYCRVIFLSGHDEFAYIYQAMHNKASQYLLKTEGDEILLDAVRECISELDKEAHSEKLRLRAKEQAQLFMPIVRRDYLSGLLRATTISSAELYAQFAKYEVSLDLSMPVMILAGWPDDPIEYAEQIDLVVSEKLSHAARLEMYMPRSGLYIWLIQPICGGELKRTAIIVKGMSENIQQTCLNTLGISVSFIFDSSPEEWSALPIKTSMLYHAVDSLTGSGARMAFMDAGYFNSPWYEERQNHSSAFVRRVNENIHQYIGNGDLSLVMLSELMYLNPAYLSRRYKELTGHTLTEVINEYRVTRSQLLLRDKSLRIRDIAEKVGISSAAHFSRLFKKQTNLTPQEWRDNN